MANADSLVLELEVKAGTLLDGLNRAVKAVDTLSAKFEGLGKTLDAFVTHFAEVGEKGKKGIKTAQTAVKGLGDETRKAEDVVAEATDNMAQSFEGLQGAIAPIGRLLATVFGTQAMWNVARTGEAFDKFAKRTGLDINKVDALGKVTELAGGNAASMREALKRWMLSGRSYDDFLYTAKRAAGLDELQRARYLEQMGLPEDVSAAFQEFGDNALKIAKAMEKISITPQQAKVARDFTQTFDLLSEYVNDIGRQFSEIVLPIVTNVMRRCIAFFNTLKKYPKETKQILTVIAALMGVKLLKWLGSAIGMLGRIFTLTKAVQGVAKVGVFTKILSALGGFLMPLKVAGGLFGALTIGAMALHSYFKKYPESWDKLCKKAEEFRKKVTSIPFFGKAFKTDKEKKRDGDATSASEAREKFAKENPRKAEVVNWNNVRFGAVNPLKENEKLDKAIAEDHEKNRSDLKKQLQNGEILNDDLPKGQAKWEAVRKDIESRIEGIAKPALKSVTQKPKKVDEKFPIYELPLEFARRLAEKFLHTEDVKVANNSTTNNIDNRKSNVDNRSTENNSNVVNNQSTKNNNVTNNNAVSNTTTNNIENAQTTISNSVVNNKYETSNDNRTDNSSDNSTRNIYKTTSYESNVGGFKPIDWKPVSRLAESFDRATNALDDSMASFVLAVSPYILGRDEQQQSRQSPNTPSVMAQTISHNTTNMTNAPVQNVNITNELNYSGNSSPSDIMRGVSRVMTRNTLGVQRMLGVANTGTCVKA